MSARLLCFVLLLLCAASVPVAGYPPAPYHRIYGAVRDAKGNPLAAGVGTVILSGTGGRTIATGISDPTVGAGINYSLKVPMDSGTTAALYSVSALRPLFPFTVRVVINRVSYVPIQMSGGQWQIGDPSKSTRIDLALGIDSDGDGLADEWEQSLIDGDPTGRLGSLADVNPDDDLDGDGLTNVQEYIAGTYAFDGRSGFDVELIAKIGDIAHFRFLAVRRRTYHFSSSSDGVTWKINPFSLDPTGSGAKPHFFSDDVGFVDAYLPLENSSHMLFKLHVE